MLKISPNFGRKSYSSDDWIMKNEEDIHEDDGGLVVTNGHPLSSSPDLEEFIRVSYLFTCCYDKRKQQQQQ